MMINLIINPASLKVMGVNMKILIFSIKTMETKELLTEEFKSFGFYISNHL